MSIFARAAGLRHRINFADDTIDGNPGIFQRHGSFGTMFDSVDRISCCNRVMGQFALPNDHCWGRPDQLAKGERKDAAPGVVSAMGFESGGQTAGTKRIQL